MCFKKKKGDDAEDKTPENQTTGRKRSRINDDKEGRERDGEKSNADEMAVENLVKKDEMETESTRDNFWKGLTPSCPSTPASQVLPEEEKLAEDDVVTNKRVLDHLIARYFISNLEDNSMAIERCANL